MIDGLLTPGGRIVWGNPARATIQKDQKTKQPIMKDGKQVEQWAFGLAIPKNEFNAQVWPQFQAEAASAYPHGVPNGFSWKIKDGDGVDRQGKPYSAREGYAGCWILTVSTTAFAPPIYKFENGAYRQLTENEIKTGDYVRVSLNVKANVPTNPSHTPGLYINPKGVEFLGYGQEIVSMGGDPDEMFGGAPAPLPVGASQAPISSAPASAAMPGQPGGQPGYQPGPQPQPAAYAPQPGGYAPAPTNVPPAAHPAPAHDFVHNAGQPQYAPQPGGQPGYQPGPQPQYAAPNAAPQPQYAPQAVTGTVPGATSYPSNGPAPQGYAPQPGMPGQPGPR